MTATPEGHRKRRLTIIRKYGSMEEYHRQWQLKRKQTLVAKYGEEGYLEMQRKSASKGGKISRKP